MYMYAIVIITLSGLTPVNSKNLQSTNDVPYRRVSRILSHFNTTVIQDNRELSQQPDRCGLVAFKCYEPILSYMDGDGEFCGWKDMNTTRTLPQICLDTENFSLHIWDSLKFEYKFIKTCDKVQTFQKCVRNNQVCRMDAELNLVMSWQNKFCDNLQDILPLVTCSNAWDSSVGWQKLVYTDWRIVQICPAKHYRQLALNTIKLYLFTYITSPSSQTDGVIRSVNAEAAGRLICQFMQKTLCLWERGTTVCSGYLPIYASQNYYDQALVSLCKVYANNIGKCNAFLNTICPINSISGRMVLKMDISDIRNVYNMTHWHAVSKGEVDILLHTDNKGIGHCDAGNLIFKQIGCFYQYITQIDMNYANHSDYLTEYMCSHIKLYNDCFDVYISSSCPDEAKQFQAIGSFLRVQCDIFKIANKNTTCPLNAVYADVMFAGESWFQIIMLLMGDYITVIKCTQMNPAPPGWRDVMANNADWLITHYKSLLIKGEQLDTAAEYEYNIISTVCDQKTVHVYKDFVTLSTGNQFYQFVNHLIKGAEYVKYVVK